MENQYMEHNMSNISLPAWVQQEENYRPSADRDFFISRSLLRLMGVLFRIRRQVRNGQARTGTAAGRLLAAILVILLLVSARTAVFLLVVLAAELVLLCLLPAMTARVVLRNGLAGMFFSALVVLPALFLGPAPAVVLIPAKTFLTVGCLSMLTESLPWHTLTACLRYFHIPALFIQILDVTLKYIVLLGEISIQMLYALKLRSVGRNPSKRQAFSGVLGATFLRSREMSQDMYEAMLCRGFTGEYPVSSGTAWRLADLWLLPAVGALALFYFYAEGVFL